MKKHLLLLLMLFLAFTVNVSAQCNISAGPDQSVCANNANVSFSAASVGAGVTIYSWSSTGSGTFSNTTAINPTYQLSASDIAQGVISFVFNGSGCGTVSDTMYVFITPAPVVNAGADQVYCSTNTINLNGTATLTNTLDWSGTGTGTFSNSSTATTIYTLSGADASLNKILFVLNGFSMNGYCNPVTDTVTVFLNATPQVNAGADKTNCGNIAGFTSTENGATSQLWTSNGTGTFDNPALPNPTYTASATDMINSVVTFVLKGINSCGNKTDTVVYNFLPYANANAGADQTVCGNEITLSGTVTDATGGTWTSSGTGTFSPSANYLNTTYIASSSDLTNGTVTLTLHTTGGQSCPANSLPIYITLTSSSSPSVTAAGDLIESSGNIDLGAGLTNASGVIWTTTGTGTFSSSTSLNPLYTPSSQDYDLGILTFKVTTTGNGACAPASDMVTISIGNLFSLYGNVKAGNDYLDDGYVTLYKYNGVSVDFVDQDTLTGSSDGLYMFENLPNGQYYIQATPAASSLYATSFQPAYYIAGITWTEADAIYINNANNAVPILQLLPFVSSEPDWNTGNDIITGVVTLTNPSLRTNNISAVSLANVIVYLKDASGNLITYTTTKNDGSYLFTNVKSGHYTIIAEYGGTTANQPVAITADGNSSTVEDGSLSVSRELVTTGILNGNANQNIGISPNPANNVINLDLNQRLSGLYVVKITDMNGVVKLQKSVSDSNGSLSLTIEELLPGMYVIQVSNDSASYSAKLIKY